MMRIVNHHGSSGASRASREPCGDDDQSGDRDDGQRIPDEIPLSFPQEPSQRQSGKCWVEVEDQVEPKSHRDPQEPKRHGRPYGNHGMMGSSHLRPSTTLTIEPTGALSSGPFSGWANTTMPSASRTKSPPHLSSILLAAQVGNPPFGRHLPVETQNLRVQIRACSSDPRQIECSVEHPVSIDHEPERALDAVPQDRGVFGCFESDDDHLRLGRVKPRFHACHLHEMALAEQSANVSEEREDGWTAAQLWGSQQATVQVLDERAGRDAR